MNVKGLKILSVVLITLLIITLIITFSDNKKDRGNFRSEIISFKIPDITRIEIASSRNDLPFSISKMSEGQWEIEREDKRFAAESSQVDNLLHTLSNLKAKQVVAKSRNNWDQYSVDDSLGTKLRLYKGNALAADIVAGRMSFSQSRNPYQQYPDAISYIRLASEETVYAVEGMLTMSLNQSANDFRNADIVKCDPQQLTRVSFTYPGDSSFVLQKENEQWNINGMPADSAHTQEFLNSLRNFTHRKFEDNTSVKDQEPHFEISVEGNNMETIRVKAFLKEEDEYSLVSSMNKETIFTLGNSQFERLFRGKSWFK